MTFTSLDFLYFFVVFTGVYFGIPNRWRNGWILAASYFFYAYWSVTYLFLLISVMAIDYAVAFRIAANHSPRRRWVWLMVSLVSNLGILCLFKYLGLFAELFAWLGGASIPSFNLILPFGISFYTFHAMSYTIDVYRRVTPVEHDFVVYSCYVLFFPQLVAGPIARASHLIPQFRSEKKARLENFINGTYLVVKGYVFKVVLADAFGGFADAYFSGATVKTPLMMTQAVYFFALQIYCDFCGYTCIARGIAKWLDFDLTENFRNPYFANSISDFWRRWHISLSSWLRDYLYISLGGNRLGAWLTYRNLFITMALGGLWHGGKGTFLIWGCIHGFYLAAEKYAAGTQWGSQIGERLPNWVKQVLVFHLVCFAWVFFRASDVTQAWAVLRQIGTLVAHLPTEFHVAELHPRLVAYAVLLFVFEYFERRYELEARFRSVSLAFALAALYGGAVVVSLFSQLNPQSFIYFQF